MRRARIWGLFLLRTLHPTQACTNFSLPTVKGFRRMALSERVQKDGTERFKEDGTERVQKDGTECKGSAGWH